MSINNNIKNSKSVIADSAYISNYYDADGKQLGFGDILSTRNFLNGITQTQAELGYVANSNNKLYEGFKLNSFLNNTNNELTKLGFNADTGKLHVIVETANEGYLIVEDRVIVPRNVTLTFRCPVLLANNANFYFSGLDKMIPPNINNKPYFTEDYPAGTTNFIINRNGVSVTGMSSWIAGNLVRFRYDEEDSGSDAVIVSCTRIGTTDEYYLVLSTPSLHSVRANVIEDGIRKYSSSALSVTSNKGTSVITVNDASPFTVGDTVNLFDTRYVSQISTGGNTSTNSSGSYAWYSRNRARHEVKSIVKIDGYNIYFNDPLVYNYDNIDTSYISLMSPQENSGIRDLTMICYEDYPYDGVNYRRVNRHKIFMQKCIGCFLDNIVYSDRFTFIAKTNGLINIQNPNIDPVIRFDKSYKCRVTNVSLNRTTPKYTSSSVGYGLVLYSCSQMFFDNIAVEGFRHNMILAGTNSSHFKNYRLTNTFGSALDLHGSGEDENIFQNFAIQSQSIQTTLGVDNITPDAGIKELVQIGNTTHACGASFNTFQNFSLKYGNPVESNVTNVYGVQIVGKSEGNILQNWTIENVDIGVAMFDFPRGRINSNLYIHDNYFNDFTIKNCNRAVLIDGAKSFSNAYSYQATTSCNYGSNTVCLDSNVTGGYSGYAGYYNNWTCIIGTSNYQVTDYDSNCVLTLSPDIAPALTSNVSLILVDSNVPSIYQIDGVNINNWKCYNVGNDATSGKTAFDLQYVKNTNIINSSFINCSSSYSNNSNNYVINSVNNSNVTILNCLSASNCGFIKTINTTNLSLLNNTHLNYQSGFSNILYDNGSNQNLTYNYNQCSGFNEYLLTSGSTSYNKQNEKYGWSNTPASPVIIINNSNGCVGFGGQTVPYAPLHFKDSASSKKVCLYETSSNNAHQFYGFGVDSGSVLRYQSASSTSGGHVFYTACNSTASREVFRIHGSGMCSINYSTPSNCMLMINSSNALTPFINFKGSVGASSNIDTDALGTYYGKIMVAVEGVGTKFIPLYNS